MNWKVLVSDKRIVTGVILLVLLSVFIVVWRKMQVTDRSGGRGEDVLMEIRETIDDIRLEAKKRYYVDIVVLVLEKGKVVDLKANGAYEFAIHSKQTLVDNVSVMSSYPELPGEQRVVLRSGIMYSTGDARIPYGMTLVNANEEAIVVEVHRTVW